MRIDIRETLGNDIVTRPHGERLRELVQNVINAGEQVTVDFGGLLVTSVSFFDEAFGTIAREIGHEGFAQVIRFEGIDPFDLALVNDIVLSRSRERTRLAGKARPSDEKLRRKSSAA